MSIVPLALPVAPDGLAAGIVTVSVSQKVLVLLLAIEYAYWSPVYNL